jgi:hypothetical protein
MRTPIFPPPRAIRYAAVVIAAVLAAAKDARGQSASDAPVTLLPPMLVREHRDGPTWRYAAVGGLEILSRCDDGTTTAFVTSYLRRKMELALLLPPTLQLQQSVPEALILITPAAQKAMNEELARTMDAAKKSEASGYLTAPGAELQVYHLVRSLPQMTLIDGESTSLLLTLDPSQRGPVALSGEASGFFKGLVDDGAYRDLTFTMQRIGGFLSGRVPALPSWFKSGFLSFYREINWTESGGTLKAGPVDWPSQDSAVPLLPPRVFFTGPLGGATPLTPRESLLWGAQASLVFHWAYSDPLRRAALWKFADLTSRQADTEDLITRCFGVGSRSLAASWAAYLPRAAKSKLPLIDEASVKIAAFRLQDATAVEAARIKGDMGRKEISYVKDLDPLSVASYVEQTGAVLRGPGEDGASDPAEVAVLGLYDCDIGAADEALPFLAEAAAAHVARPTLYVELAKIRDQRALAQPTGTEGKLGPEQVAALIGLLRESRRYAPAQAGAYQLAADIWNQAANPPSRENLALLDEGVEFFPGDFDLVAGSAKLYAQGGDGPDALRLVDHALALSDPSSGLWLRLTALRAQIVAPAAAGKP